MGASIEMERDGRLHENNEDRRGQNQARQPDSMKGENLRVHEGEICRRRRRTDTWVIDCDLIMGSRGSVGTVEIAERL